ncbi:MAG: sigma-70 family RNA polymerase sigma factor [Phycisphaerales bacterium]|nr:sigma-70 family RNA polymerase sigma factor [Phycisphaerales bacterium]
MPEPSHQSVDLQACLSGDSRAWSAFVSGTAGLVIAAVRRTLGPSGPPSLDVDDLVQQVYLKLLQNDMRLMRQYDPARSGVSTWITLISRSTTIDALRRKRLPVVPAEAALSVPIEDQAPEHRESVIEALPADLLTDRQIVVLRLIYDDGLDVAEVAQVLGVEAQTIRSTRHKAMLRLRAHFSETTDPQGNPTGGMA